MEGVKCGSKSWRRRTTSSSGGGDGMIPARGEGRCELELGCEPGVGAERPEPDTQADNALNAAFRAREKCRPSGASSLEGHNAQLLPDPVRH